MAVVVHFHPGAPVLVHQAGSKHFLLSASGTRPAQLVL